MNKKEKAKRCREILHKYNIGDLIVNNEDFEFLMKIFEGHSEWERKKGVGIKYFTICQTEYKNRCFVIKRMDNSRTDISYLHALKNRSGLCDIKRACRRSVRPVIFEFKNNLSKQKLIKCQITGAILTMDDVHIDHYDLTFDEVFREWIKDKDIDYLKSQINETNDNEVDTMFLDADLCNDFVAFHNNNTHLRAVSKSANLSSLRKSKTGKRGRC